MHELAISQATPSVKKTLLPPSSLPLSLFRSALTCEVFFQSMVLMAVVGDMPAAAAAEYMSMSCGYPEGGPGGGGGPAAAIAAADNGSAWWPAAAAAANWWWERGWTAAWWPTTCEPPLPPPPPITPRPPWWWWWWPAEGEG